MIAFKPIQKMQQLQATEAEIQNTSNPQPNAPRTGTASSQPLNIKVKKVAKTDMDLGMQEDPPIEEHLILRLPATLAEQLRPSIQSRTISSDIQFTFTDLRRGTFRANSETFPLQLFDLPCITESLKTLDNKQYYKIADISQMIVVHSDPLEVKKDPIYPHGISERLFDVRRRRFRKRMNKKTIEDVEAEVERLLLADIASEEVRWEVHERKDDEFEEDDEEYASEEGGEPTKELDYGAFDELINEALLNDDQGQEGDDKEDSEDEDEEEESEGRIVDNDIGEEEELLDVGDGDDEDESARRQKTSIANEIRELERIIEEKMAEANAHPNPIIKKRFLENCAKMRGELQIKKDKLASGSEEEADILFVSEDGSRI